MKKLKIETLENIVGGVNGTTCFIVGALSVGWSLGPLFLQGTIKECWNS